MQYILKKMPVSYETDAIQYNTSHLLYVVNVPLSLGTISTSPISNGSGADTKIFEQENEFKVIWSH
jgi:hypothetical protein